MYLASHVIYTIITISTAWYFNQSFQYLIPLAVHTEDRTPVEPIRTWHTGTMIRMRE